jgi:hypothetical protein
MDREAAVICSEMSQTRVELERKLERLEARAQELGPWQYVKRFVPEYWLDRTIGTVLILCGLTMARKRFRRT